MAAGSRFVLVTGTDTGVGKTVVTAALARTLHDRGVAVRAIKPMESGCGVSAASDEDGVMLARAAGQPAPTEALHRFGDPIAPAEAAERAGVRIELGSVVAAIRRIAPAGTLGLVEGAGGVLSPLSWDWGHLDLATALEASVLVVAADRLGTVNHTLLTLAAIRDARRPVVGLVLCAPAEPDASTGANQGTLARLEPELRIARLPRIPAADRERARLPEVAEWLAR